MAKLILSLCDYTGNWPSFYTPEDGYEVMTVDLAHGADVRMMEYMVGRAVHGILAAPPCTVFAQAGYRWPRTQDDMLAGLSIVDACLRAVAIYRPAWWVLENPQGRLHKWLGPPTMIFQPHHYGDPYTKRTLLWGDFDTSLRRTPVVPILGSIVHWKVKDPRVRATTPLGFARAFREANP